MESDQAKLLITVASQLDREHISYMITGAWSVIFYGRPRASHDIDFIVELNKKDTERVVASWKNLSPDFLIQPGAIAQAIQEKGMFTVLHRDTMLKLDFWLLTDDPFDASRFQRRKRVQILGKMVEIASAEDTVLQKLRWYKEAQLEKHLVDAAFVYQIQGRFLDAQYLNAWAKKLGVAKYLKKLDSIDLELYL